jgi:hypothetical protein
MSCNNNTPNINKTFIVEPNLNETFIEHTISSNSRYIGSNDMYLIWDDLTIESGSTLNNDGRLVVVNGDFNNFGSYSGSGTIELITTNLEYILNYGNQTNGNLIYYTNSPSGWNPGDTISTISSATDNVLVTKEWVDSQVSGLTDNNDFTTGATLINNTIYFDRNDSSSAYTIDLTDIVFSGGSGNCISDLFVTNIYGCSPITFNDELILVSGITLSSTPVNNNVLTQILARDSSTGEIGYRDASSIISAATSQDKFITGGTYSQSGSSITLFRNDNVPIQITGITTDDTFITGMTFNPVNYQITSTRNDGVSTPSIDLSILSADVTITGGTYDIDTGVVTFTNNSGGTFNVSGFTSGMTDTYTTTANLSGNSITFDSNINGSNFYNVDLTPILSGKTDVSLFNSHTGDTSNPHNVTIEQLSGVSETLFNTYTGDTSTLLSTKVSNGNNIGGGNGELFKNKTGTTLNFRTLSGGTNTTVTAVGDVNVIDVVDIFTTGSTLIGETIYFDTNDSLSAYTSDLSPLVIWENSSGSGSVVNKGGGNSLAGMSSLSFGTNNVENSFGVNNTLIGNQNILSGFNATVTVFGSQNINDSSVSTFITGGQNENYGTNSNLLGTQNIIYGNNSNATDNTLIGTQNIVYSGSYNFITSLQNRSYGSNNVILSRQSIISGETNSILGGRNHLILNNVTGSTILGGKNITGSTNDTVYGVNFNASGNILSGGTDLSNIFSTENTYTTGGTYGGSTLTLNDNGGGSVSITGVTGQNIMNTDGLTLQGNYTHNLSGNTLSFSGDSIGNLFKLNGDTGEFILGRNAQNNSTSLNRHTNTVIGTDAFIYSGNVTHTVVIGSSSYNSGLAGIAIGNSNDFYHLKLN